MIYLDNNATTFLSPEVLKEIDAFLSMPCGNPSSVHFFGQKAKGLLSSSLQRCARYFKCAPNEIIFTSGATEGLNMLIRSLPKKGHIITSSLEHAAVLESLKYSGCSVTYLDPLPGQGSILPDQITQAIRDDTIAIVLTAANNETGIKTDLLSVEQIAKRQNILFIVDGVALLGKETLCLSTGVSAIVFSGHKIHAPTGIGLSIIRKPLKFHPFIVGGPQQHNLRGGTENLLGIIAFAKAIEEIEKHGMEDTRRMERQRDALEKGILENLSDVLIHGKDLPRVCNTSNIAFLGVEGESLLMRLDMAKVAVSHGAACSSGALEPSRILLNMGLSPKIARSSIRFSLSRFTTDEEIEKTIDIVSQIVQDLRKVNV